MPAPDIGVPLGVPVGRGRLNGVTHLRPRGNAAAFERQRPPPCSPRCDQADIGRVDRLTDERPAGRAQGKSHDSGGTMPVAIVQHGLDRLRLLWHPGVDALPAVYPLGNGASSLERGMHFGPSSPRSV